MAESVIMFRMPSGAATQGEGGRPLGVRAFVFTDVERSTATWEQEPEAMGVAMTRLAAICDDVADRFGGRRAVEQGAGDSTVTVFESPSAAVAAALAMQQQMTVEPWPTAEPVRVRVAVHAGEVTQNPDGTFAGPTMNRCGRLLAAAHGAQVVASASSIELAGDLAPEMEVLDLGSHHLRGIEQPVRVCQLWADGLPRSFPPLRTVDAANAGLPRYRSRLVGQDRLLDELSVLVSVPGIVTLVGTGGCGKTRLAAEVATRSVEGFRDGVVWVDLASLRDALLVDDAMAAAFGVRRGSRPPRDQVIEHLRTRQVLVVLDNCEHLIDAAAGAAVAVRDGCPAVAVLATSREPLNVSEEVVRRVPSLRVPDQETVEAVLASEAGAFLLDRLGQASPGTTVTGDDAPAFAEVCRRLDGIPLALELAAARIRVSTPRAVAEGLSERFRLLTGGSRNALARQRTLEASVAWSYQLLPEAEAAMFRRVCVLAGPFTVDAAVVIAGADGDYREVADALSSLLDRSLLQDAGGGRVRMLETLRHFARERLLESGEADEVRDRHLGWFAEACRDVDARLWGPEPRVVLDEIDRQVDDLRAAMQWAIDSGRGDQVVAITVPTVWYWILRARIPEALEWLRRAAADELAPERQLQAAWATLHMLVHHNAVHDEMEPVWAAAIDLAVSLGDHGMEGRLKVVWGAHLGFRDPDAGIAMLDEARTLCDSVGDGHWGAYAEGSIALCWTFRGRDDLAAEHLRAMTVRRQALESHRMMIEDLTRRAIVDYPLGRYDSVVDAAATVTAALEGISEINVQGTALAFAGSVEIERGGASQVVADMERLLERYLRDGELQHIPSILLTLSRALLAEGRADAAAAHLLSAWSVPDLQAFVRARLWFRHDLALADLLAGRSEAAVAGFGEMLDDATRVDNPQEQARAHFWLGQIDRRRGEAVRAGAHLHTALDIHARHGFRQLAAGALEAIAGLELDHRRPVVATRVLGAAAAVRAEAGVTFRLGWQTEYEADVDSARAALDDVGFAKEWDAGAAAGLDDAVDVARRGRGSRGRPAFGRDSLTTTEEKVAAFLVEGRTNPEIAEALLMGRETVKTHVSSILRKLGLGNRTQVASALAARGEVTRRG